MKEMQTGGRGRIEPAHRMHADSQLFGSRGIASPHVVGDAKARPRGRPEAPVVRRAQPLASSLAVGGQLAQTN